MLYLSNKTWIKEIKNQHIKAEIIYIFFYTSTNFTQFSFYENTLERDQ